MGKVIFMTNVIRRLGIMQQMLEKLQNRGELAGDYSCWWVTENTEWDEGTEKRLAGTDFLLLKWMGTGLTTTFLKRVHAYARQHHIPYYIDAAGGDDDNLIQGITPEQEGISVFIPCMGAKAIYTISGCIWTALRKGIQIPFPSRIQSTGPAFSIRGPKRCIRIWRNTKKISAARDDIR